MGVPSSFNDVRSIPILAFPIKVKERMLLEEIPK